MDILGQAISALLHGIDVRDLLAVILVSIVVVQLRELTRLQAISNTEVHNLGNKLDEHNRHQTARMEEVRKFMLSWWERFAPHSEPKP